MMLFHTARREHDRLPGLWFVAVVVIVFALATVIQAGRRATPRTLPVEPTSEGMLIDVNRASAAELTLLPGVGRALADRIVADREVAGPFLSIEALDRVSGIGMKTIDRFRAFVTVGENEVVSPSQGH